MQKKHLLLALLIISVIFPGSSQRDTLRVGVFESPPFVIYNEDGKMEGVSVWLWEQLEQEMDLPYKLVRFEGEQPLADLISSLETGEIDMAINPITITRNRDLQIDFSHPIYIGNLTIAKRANAKVNTYLSLLADFFNQRLLLLIFTLIGLVLFFGFLIWLIEKGNHHFEKNFRGLLSSFWWSAVTMTTVGYGDKVPLSHAGRLLAFIWMLCSIIIISVFTASVTSNLTIKKLAETDISLDTFKRDRVGTVRSSASEEYLERNFFRNLKSFPEFFHALDGLKSGEVDYLVYDEPWLQYQLNSNSKYSDLEIIPLQFNLSLYALPMKDDLDHDLEDELSTNIIRLTETRDWDAVLSEYHMQLY